LSTGGAKSGVQSNLMRVDDPQFAELCKKWPQLTEDRRKIILAIINSD
jgi:hypothetical protein